MRDDVVSVNGGDVDAPLHRVLLTYGRSHLPEFLLGGVASALSIALELLPSYLLGVAIDVFFTNARPFSLPLVPDAWLPTAVREQFVLDEATSHVDNETETVIRRQLADLTADRTTFAIAHRLSTVRDADTILVFDDGRLVERGSHEDLLARDGLYADLWAVQVGAVEDLPARFTAAASPPDRTD